MHMASQKLYDEFLDNYGLNKVLLIMLLRWQSRQIEYFRPLKSQGSFIFLWHWQVNICYNNMLNYVLLGGKHD